MINLSRLKSHTVPEGKIVGTSWQTTGLQCNGPLVGLDWIPCPTYECKNQEPKGPIKQWINDTENNLNLKGEMSLHLQTWLLGHGEW